ncbi:hypothetical protein AVEN_101619-1 [Araneus ventricosus]|uniref:Uncharacterized protein n=1 Tax=Araneus ventricosus TaxID=182803 RepID=A0A4Y2EVJ3_ARAVE|nr:hypothetical protein AVEN_101619-1 [Araneus ventricosus]
MNGHRRKLVRDRFEELCKAGRCTLKNPSKYPPAVVVPESTPTQPTLLGLRLKKKTGVVEVWRGASSQVIHHLPRTKITRSVQNNPRVAARQDIIKTKLHKLA